MKLSDFAGHWLVVYFYPKDDTPGCTIQGKSFSAPRLISTLPESKSSA
jgi:peroxiredoxin Q/BCP